MVLVAGSDKNRGRSMSLNDNLAIHEEDAQRINRAFSCTSLGESGANEIAPDRPERTAPGSRRGLAVPRHRVASFRRSPQGGRSGSTAAMARLLGETEFTMLFHRE